MKKFLAVFLICALCFAFAACGSKDDGGTDQSEPEVAKIEKTVDAVAEELGLGEGSETLYEMIGAEAGKEYKDGEVELYLFDEGSDEYKDIEAGNGVIEAAATNSGMIILADDEELVNKFKEIQFK